MDRNKIVIINELSLEEIDKNSIKFIIDGNDIQTEKEYFEIITEKFEFPQFNNQLCNINGYLDWMTDLSWLEEKFERFDNISLIIKNYREAFNGNLKDIDYFLIELFEEDILPYWDKHEIIPKKFNVYLVSDLKEKYIESNFKNSNFKITNIIDFINLIRKRPGMYIGGNQLDNLYFTINGFFMNDSFNNRTNKVDILFREMFSNWVRNLLNSKENLDLPKAANYVYHIKAVCKEEKEQLDKFFELFDLFVAQYKNKIDDFTLKIEQENFTKE